MSKRAPQFERRPNDYYATPFKAVLPLIEHLPRACYYIEPCAGDGALVRHLQQFGHTCIAQFDIEPRGPGIDRRSAFSLRIKSGNPLIITNPPWDRAVLHPMIRHLSAQAETWLLFDSDWLFTRQATEFMPICHKVVAVGRVRWIEGTDMDGKDNCAWFQFDARRRGEGPRFYGRAA